jgi:enoyl-CoA hydratase/carnithine racemase
MNSTHLVSHCCPRPYVVHWLLCCNQVHPSGEHEKRAIQIAADIAAKSQVTVAICREAVNAAFELPLQEGLKAEKAAFFSCFATEDQKEGMKAFIEKRKPAFSHK